MNVSKFAPAAALAATLASFTPFGAAQAGVVGLSASPAVVASPAQIERAHYRRYWRGHYGYRPYWGGYPYYRHYPRYYARPYYPSYGYYAPYPAYGWRGGGYGWGW